MARNDEFATAAERIEVDTLLWYDGSGIRPYRFGQDEPATHYALAGADMGETVLMMPLPGNTRWVIRANDYLAE